MGYTFLSSQTASGSSSLDFTSGIDGTYNEYLFTIVNFKPATDEKHLGFQVDTGTNTNYNQTITSTALYAGTSQSGGWTSLTYASSHDQAEGTALEQISYSGEGTSYADMSVSGQLRLYAPNNGTYVKHYMSTLNTKYTNDNSADGTWAINLHGAGYFNTTTALTRVRFATNSGNIHTGTFTLYGVG